MELSVAPMFIPMDTSNPGRVMHEATFSELRNRAKHYFDLVEAGEVVRVLRNGRPIAEIHPIPSAVPSWNQRQARPVMISGGEIGRLIIEERRS